VAFAGGGASTVVTNNAAQVLHHEEREGEEGEVGIKRAEGARSSDLLSG
jgi:hypothetical protein